MSKGRKTENNTKDDEIVFSKSKSPLVFISHDSRDAEIAEAFSHLLSNISAGVLKSFRSSDKKGTQGIQYGVEWYPEVMKKLNEATDIVCLLTQSSIERPWILYEAGVAKGKLDTTVLGIVTGIPLNNVNNSPFAQFQNCDDEEDSLTKLVMQLAKRIPNSEPVEETIRQQVKTFKVKLDGLLKKQSKSKDKIPEEVKEDTSTAKLFEEIKIMFQDLPSRIDRRLDPESMMRRRRKFNPFILDEMMHMGWNKEDPNLGFLMMIGLFRDDFPWMYEVGLETYRGLKTAKTAGERKKILSTFEHATEMLNHPMMRDIYGKHDDMLMFHKEFRHIMQRYIHKFMENDK